MGTSVPGTTNVQSLGACMPCHAMRHPCTAQMPPPLQFRIPPSQNPSSSFTTSQKKETPASDQQGKGGNTRIRQAGLMFGFSFVQWKLTHITFWASRMASSKDLRVTFLSSIRGRTSRRAAGVSSPRSSRRTWWLTSMLLSRLRIPWTPWSPVSSTKRPMWAHFSASAFCGREKRNQFSDSVGGVCIPASPAARTHIS